jgi:hypothetical protein
MPSRVLFACAVSAGILCAQPQPPIRSWADADKIEADLQSRPDDLNLRVQLLRYYTQQSAQSAGRVKPLRRKHVLWMVENHPEHSVLSEWVGALDPSGHELADAEGYTACSAAWQKALAAAKPLFDTFGNAIYFYKTADPARAHQIAEDGLKLYPGNARILQRKGMLLAHAILGVKSVDQFGRAVAFDDVAAAGAQAVRDRKTLEASDDPNLLSGAAAALTGQVMALRNRGDRLAAMEELVTLLYRRADEVDPNMGRWKAALTGAYQSFAAVSDTPGKKIRYLEMGSSAILMQSA